MTELRIDPESTEPPSAQVRRQVTTFVVDGSWAPGHRLPTVRALADELGVAVNTVAKAYKQLEADGVIETRGRSGSFVSASDLDAAAAEFVARAHRGGATLDEARRLVEQHWPTSP